MTSRTMAVLLCLGTFGPAAAWATKMKITSEPPGAAVQLDGVAVGVTPVTVPKVDKGAHALKISLEGYTTREDSLTVDGDADLEVHAPLAPAPKVIEPQKPIPAKVEAPKPEPKPAKVEAPKVEPAPAPANAADPKALPSVPAVEAPAPAKVETKTLVLVVETVPADATVQVVGMKEIKRAPATFSGFAPGIVRLVVRAPGYKDKKVEVDLQFDSRTKVVLKREK